MTVPRSLLPTCLARDIRLSRAREMVVFDQDVAGTDGKIICRAGCVYVRRNGQSVPAQFSEVQAITEKIITRGVQAFLARVDQIATLPAGANLIAANPGSSEGFILTARGEGVPVQIIGPEEGAPTVTLSEDILPDTPLSKPSLEVAGQVRQWRTDANHRVPAAVISRWYRERASINVLAINGAAEFLLLSALHENCFPIHYWAGRLDKARLRELLKQLIVEDSYPERHNVPYVVGAFLWDERPTLLAPHAVQGGSYAGYDRVIRADDQEQFLLRGRAASERFELPSGVTVRLTEDVLSDFGIASEIFDACLQEGDEYIRNHRGHLHQLDLWLNGSHHKQSTDIRTRRLVPSRAMGDHTIDVQRTSTSGALRLTGDWSLIDLPAQQFGQHRGLADVGTL